MKKAKKVVNKYSIAYDFATKAYRKFNKIIKSIALFGSVAKNEAKVGSDIDIIIVIDDCSVVWDQELIAWYREELAKLIGKQKYADQIHVNTVTLTAFWQAVRAGDATTINILRYGQTLIDFGGFFEPLKVLLAQGKIRPTSEAVYTTLKRAPMHITRSRFSVLSAVEGLYWACVDSAHAALMAADEVPPSPEHVAEMLRQNEKIRISRKYARWYEEIYEVAHAITQGRLMHIKGSKIDEYDYMANKFVEEMSNVTQKLMKDKKIIKTKMAKIV